MGKGNSKTITGSKGRSSRKKNLILLSMTLPGVIWFLALRYIPMFGIALAFNDYKVQTKPQNFIQNMLQSEWVGFRNFKFLFSTTDSLMMLRNTIGYNILWIALGVVICLALAIILNEITAKFAAKTYQTLMFFPYFISWVVAAYFVNGLLDATNGMLVKWQIEHFGTATNWYFDNGPWPVILTIANLWKNIGYQTMLYYAAITGVDTTLYEAAAIDGASKWKQAIHVTIPSIRSMVIILLIMNVGKILNSDFGLFWNIPAASNYLIPTTQVIDTYVYRALTTTSLGMSTAAGLFQNVIGFILIVSLNHVVNKIDPESALY